MTGAAMSDLRLLLWLKLKLQWRALTRDVITLIGTIFGLLFFGQAAVWVGVGCGVGFFMLPPAMAEHLLAGVLLAIYGLWLLLPAFSHSLSESYDITKLLLYPVATRRIVMGVVAGSVVDLSFLLVLPVALATLIAFHGSMLGFPLVAIALALFLFHGLTLSQGALLVGAGMLRSRRFRDIMIVVVPLISLIPMLVYWYGLGRGPDLFDLLRNQDWSAIMVHPAWRIVDFTPPGVAARAIADADHGHYLAALGLMAVLAALAAASLSLAARLVRLIETGHVVGSRPRERARERAAPARGGERMATPLRGLPPVLAAVVGKELKYLWRETYFKSALVGAAGMLAIGIFMFVRPWGSTDLPWDTTGIMIWMVPPYMFMGEMGLLLNLFGTEGAAAAVLFLSPAPRRQILIAKSLVMTGAMLAVNAVMVAVLAAVVKRFELFPALFMWTELGTVMVAAVGNVLSVLAPVGLVRRGWRLQARSAGWGCGYGLMTMASLAVAFGLALPVLAAALVPTFWAARVWFVLTVPLAAGYTAVIYLISLRLAEPLLEEREFEIVERLTREGK
jgi:ABC-2 type transport system permease protein